MEMNLSQMKELSLKHDKYYFDSDNVKFFDSRVIKTANRNQLFIECYNKTEPAQRCYLVKIITTAGEIDTIDPAELDGVHFPTLEAAQAFRERLSAELGREYEEIALCIKLFGDHAGFYTFTNNNGDKKTIDTNALYKGGAGT